MTGVSRLLGRTLRAVNTGSIDGNDALEFVTLSGEKYCLYHSQCCCEDVYLEDVCGNWEDLLMHPLLLAEEVDNDLPPLSEGDDSYTWTFYRFATIKGSVTLRWYGTSNGYYSESVEFESADKLYKWLQFTPNEKGVAL